MSAISEAMKNAPKAQKTFKDIYKGPATVKEVTPLEPRFTDGLTEEEAASAFDIQLIVTPDDANVPEQEILIAYSSRKTKFDPTKSEAEKAVEDLGRQGLVTNGDITTVFSCAGKKCNINAYEETSAKGTFPRCRLQFGQAKLSQTDILKRIAAMTGKPAAAPQTAPTAPTAPKAAVNPFA